jgi:hypothetical protein
MPEVAEPKDEPEATPRGPTPQPALVGDAGVKSLRDVAKPIPLLLGALVAGGATVAQLLSTYDGFFGEAIGSWASWVLILMNIALTVALMLGLTPLFKPRNVLLYALTVALSFQTLLATDLAFEPLAGTDQVGTGQKVNVGFIQTELEKFLTGEIDDPVEDAKREEIAALRARYPSDDQLPTLRSDIDDNLRTDGDIDETERKTILEQIDGLIADSSLNHSEKVREITLAVYSIAGRDPIQDLVDRG